MRNELDKFMREFKERVENLPNVEKVEFFGSITTPAWIRGKSDVDVIVYGDNIPAKVKREIILILRELNEKYDLKLEKVRCCHPTPFFLDSPLRRQLFREMVSGHKALIELGREWCKESAPTYGEIWAMEDSIL